MIKFVNAKINLGLNVVAKRQDGYHDLSTVFYPVGIHAGTPLDKGLLADTLEIVEGTEDKLTVTGNDLDCPNEKNLVWKALTAFKACRPMISPVNITLDKHLPSQAGLGGGSADASFTLKALNEICHDPLSEIELLDLARNLGADCPFFIINKPCSAAGIGDILSPIPLDLSGKWLAIIKPDVNISTAEAFRYVKPHDPELHPRDIVALPISAWRHLLKNDFEISMFTLYPELSKIKSYLYDMGALYASMSGSGSTFYGIFADESQAREAINHSYFAYQTIALL